MLAAGGFASVDGTDLYYEMLGTGHPLVLIHAGISDCRMWDEQFSVFAELYRVIRYDVRGFGRSKMPDEPFSVIGDLYALLRFLNVDRAHLLGLSMGGSIALSLTVAHPEVVSALIPVASGLRGYSPSPEVLDRRSRIAVAVDSGDRSKLIALMLTLWADGVTGRARPAVRARVGEIFEENVSTLFMKSSPHKDPPWQTIDRLSEIRAPTLIIVGDRDQPDILAIADLLEARIGGAVKVQIPGAAHMVNMEQPQEFNHLVLEFLERRKGPNTQP